MKTFRIFISLVIIFLIMSGGIGSRPVQAADNPSLYYTQAELDILKTLKTAPSHSSIWDGISTWANAHVNDALPSMFSGSGNDAEATAYEYRRWFETMVFMYHMTDDTVYADAVKNRLLHVARTWNRWDIAGGQGRPVPAEFSIGVAQAWTGIKEYLTESERAEVIAHVIAMVEMPRGNSQVPAGQLYGRYTDPDGTDWRVPAVSGTVSGTCSVIGGCGVIGLAFLDDAPSHAQNWIDYAEENIAWVLGRGWVDGPHYSIGAFEMLSSYWIAADILGRSIPDDDILDGFTYYLIYLTCDRNPVQMEDSTGRNAGATPLWKPDATRLGFMWWIANRFDNGYSQMFADLYGTQNCWEHYVYYKGSVEAESFASLPLSRYFDNIGYVVWRSGFDNEALVFITKFGQSIGHAHMNQGSFSIWNDRWAVSTGHGYGYPETQWYSCLIVDVQDQDYSDVNENGVVQAVAETSVYRYVRGDSSTVWGGMVDLNQRQIVMVNGQDYFVVFDRAHSSTPRQFDYRLNGTNRGSTQTNIAGNIITITRNDDDIVLQDVIVYPSTFHSVHEAWQAGEYEAVRIHPEENTTTAHFLNVLFVPGHSDILPITEVAQGNCSGVIVANGDQRDVILFSTDGNPVNQNIELGGYYQSADGNPYTFNGTQVLADFDTYQVMGLEAGTGENQPPVLAAIGNKSVREGNSLGFTVTATDPNGDPLTYSASNLPAWASFTPATRTFSGTAGQAGTYSNVHFEVSDGVLTDSENITITVTTNNAPVLGSIGNKTVAEGQQLQFVITATDSDNDTLTYSASSLPSGASFNGTSRAFSWTPGYTEAGSYPSVHFQVSDGSLTDSEDITITVTNVNRPPVLGAIGNRSVNEGQSLTFTISATDPDDDSLTYSASSLPSGASFNGTSRAFSWTPLFTQAGSYPNVHFQVSDGALTDTEDITITVTNVNRPPVLGAIGNRSVNEGQTLTFTISATDPDGGTLTYSASSLPSGASFTAATRTFTWTPGYTQAGSYSNVHFQVSDGALTDTEDITITVTNVNRPPVLGVIGNRSVNEGQALTFTISATDPDGGTLTYSASSLPSGASFTPATRTFTWTPTSGQAGSYPGVHFQVSDSALTDSEDITITVNVAGTNNPPVLDSIGSKVVDEGQSLTFIISATDTDGDPLSYSASSLPSGATFTPATRTFTWTPTSGQVGSYPDVLFSVTDSELTDSENITITVNNVNVPPVLASIGNKTVTEGQSLQFTISATDPDGDSLTYSASNLPTGASFNGTSRAFSWTPDSTQAGSYQNVHFEVTDGVLVDSENITITVNSSSSLPSGGDSGGGGGGGGGGSGATSLLDSMTMEGRIVSEVLAMGVDQKVKIIIPRNTIVKNKNGQRVNAIRIIQSAEQISAGWDARGISLSYDIQPGGTTFDPYAILVYEYSDKEIPQGISENSLYIVLWDPINREWIDLGGTVDAAANTVSVQIQHLSIYALLARIQPASFEVTDLSLTPREVGLGETVTVSFVVNNNGDLTGTYEVGLKLDNTTVETKSVTLAGGDSETETFDITSNAAGEHQANIGDMLATFVVKAPQTPATFAVSEINITPTEVNSGENVIVNVLVKNSGDLSGRHEVILKIDDVAVQTKGVSIDSGESETVSFNITPDTVGIHNVNIGSLSGSYEVKSPPPPPVIEVPRLQVETLDVAPIYDEQTNKLINAKIVYQMNQPYASFPGTRLSLKVLFENELLETVPLLTLSQLQSDGKTGELSYIPSAGWLIGNYSFQVELYEGESLVQEIPSPQLTVTPEAITRTVSWWILGATVGAATLAIAIVIALVVYRRRDMLRG
jgi:hypothetical protein